MMIDDQAHLGVADLVGLANGAPLGTVAGAHLDSCPDCQAEARSWSVIATGVRTIMAETRGPAAGLDGVLAAIGGESGASGRPPLAAASPVAGRPRRPLPGWHPAAAAAVIVAVLGGGGLGIASTLSPGVRGSGQVMTAALTATSCPSMKLAIGTLSSVTGSTLVLKPVIGPAVRVSTTASTTVTREVTGTLADVRDGMHVIVSGTSSHGEITARRIGVTPSSLAAKAPALNVPALNVPALPFRTFQPALALGLANGTVADATTAGFTVDEPRGTHVRVSTSSSTTVVTLTKVTVAGLRTGQRTVAVGSVTGHNALAASSVEQEDLPLSQLGPPALSQAGYLPGPRLVPTRFPRLLPRGLPRSLRTAYGRPDKVPSPFPAMLPRPGALFSGLGCNARAIAATGMLVAP